MAIKSIFLVALALAAVSAERQYSWDQIGEVSDRLHQCLGELGDLPNSGVHIYLSDVCANTGTQELFAGKTLEAVTPAVVGCMRKFTEKISEDRVAEAEKCMTAALAKPLSEDSDSESDDSSSNDPDIVDDDQVYEIRELIRDCLEDLPADPNYGVHIQIGDECSNDVMFHLRAGGSKKQVVSIVMRCVRSFPKIISEEQVADAEFCVSGFMEAF